LLLVVATAVVGAGVKDDVDVDDGLGVLVSVVRPAVLTLPRTAARRTAGSSVLGEVPFVVDVPFLVDVPFVVDVVVGSGLVVFARLADAWACVPLSKLPSSSAGPLVVVPLVPSPSAEGAAVVFIAAVVEKELGCCVVAEALLLRVVVVTVVVVEALVEAALPVELAFVVLVDGVTVVFGRRVVVTVNVDVALWWEQWLLHITMVFQHVRPKPEWPTGQ
jgi:hypothetical protein